MPTSQKLIRFHFDFLSPYSFIADCLLPALASRHDALVVGVPTLLPGLLNHHGHKGPAEIPAKLRYVVKDVYRTATKHGIRLRPPDAHPFNPLLALRVARLFEGDDAVAVRRSIFRYVWGDAPRDGRSPDDQSLIIDILNEIGFSGADVVARALAPENKKGLQEDTQSAIDSGVFGVPSMVVDGELFWGVDSLTHLEDHLDGKDPVQHVELHSLMAQRSTASRM